MQEHEPFDFCPACKDGFERLRSVVSNGQIPCEPEWVKELGPNLQSVQMLPLLRHSTLAKMVEAFKEAEDCLIILTLLRNAPLEPGLQYGTNYVNGREVLLVAGEAS